MTPMIAKILVLKAKIKRKIPSPLRGDVFPCLSPVLALWQTALRVNRAVTATNLKVPAHIPAFWDFCKTTTASAIGRGDSRVRSAVNASGPRRI